MAKEDDNGKLHSEQNGRFVSKGDAEEKRAEAERIYNSEYPNSSNDEFTGGSAFGKDVKSQTAPEDKTTIKEQIVEVDMDADVQKLLSAVETSKERQKIAFKYIMDNLRGQYEAPDGRTVAIERVGADKMTYRDNKDKLRVCPALADLIKVGEYDHSSPSDEKANKKFEEFAYYKVRVKIGGEVFTGMLNVGIRKNGSSTLYDLRPFYKENL